MPQENGKVKKNDWLLEYAKDVTSQCGEDGIIEKIFELIPDTQSWCVDIGAWDGKHRSNIYNLITNKGWSGALIETDPARVKELRATYEGNAKVSCLNQHIEFSGEHTLDGVLSTTSIPKDYSLLCVDIDGNDYHIWDSVSVYSPKVVCIEFNPTIPNHIAFVQPRDMKVNQGSSLKALVALGKQKGYELVCATRLNAFFVRREFFASFNIADNSPEQLFKETRYFTTLFHLYDGTVVLDGCDMVMWHGVKFDKERLQPIPKAFRIFPSVMSAPRLFAFKVWRKLLSKG